MKYELAPVNWEGESSEIDGQKTYKIIRTFDASEEDLTVKALKCAFEMLERAPDGYSLSDTFVYPRMMDNNLSFGLVFAEDGSETCEDR